MKITPPRDLDELMVRAYQISGLTLGDLAHQLHIKTPANLKREKGWIGQVIELALGAEAGSKPEQDFPSLAVELKTLPINQAGEPLETTYVCYAPITQVHTLTWETSNVRNKLSHVLWVPILSERTMTPSERQIGTPFLWRPTFEDDAQLQQDWSEIMELIALGKIDQISAKQGTWLQLRPKAANGQVLTDGIGHEGERIKTRPRGFYLRKAFTSRLLRNQFDL